LTVSVKDFGRGMAPPKKGSTPGLGLIAMRERAELIGAQLRISSVPNVGATVTLSMPVQQYEPALETPEHQKLDEVISAHS